MQCREPGLRGRLFVTGASGYVGRAVLAHASARGLPLAALSRSGTAPDGAPDGVEWIKGDLLQPAGWKHQIERGDIVLHLAAATGKANAAAHRAVNVEGTRALCRAAANAGAAHLLFVSSIAVRFPDQSHYPYAHAKADAERCVRGAELPWTIVRPAIVVGQDAPVLGGFALLAGLPLIPVFGDGERRVQPIDVGDLADALLDLAEQPPASTVVELGGPEVVTLNDWMQRIRDARGRGTGRRLHLPIGPIRSLLALVEPVLLPILPLTAGQLATFANDGVPEPSPFLEERQPRFRPLDDSLALAPPARLAARAYDATRLTAECHALSKHLIGREAPTRVVAGYLEHHRERPVGPLSRFDARLTDHAGRGGASARLADAYSARVLPRGMLRRKLGLLVALLETDADSFEVIDAPDAGARGGAWLALLGSGVAEVVIAIVAVIRFGPAHLFGRGPAA